MGAMANNQQHYSIFRPPSLSMSELVKTTFDEDVAFDLINRWLDRPQDLWTDWFCSRKYSKDQKQILVWNKGDFVLDNIFCRTVDTGRLMPLRGWTTHIYHRSESLQDRKRPMKPVLFTMLPELLLLRAMHDVGCDEIFIIVTDLQRQEMDEITEYFKLVCRHAFGRAVCKPSMKQHIQLEHMRITHALNRYQRTPCFPQIDLTLRAILYEKNPRFIILFSRQPTSYSQILFTHHSYVPDEELYYDYPIGCPNPCCTDNCEMLRFPRRGLETANVLEIKRGGKFGRRVKQRSMCNWIECDVCFSEDPPKKSGGGSNDTILGQLCSQCRLVKYCSPEHQRKDWAEHKKVCAKMDWVS
ncbi:hypothetical protein D9757_007038 [Collybiopsis confluens]|uniref:MYND-type domain-containing protein n=1 Tax=Collybiopsis confluens TaxID=2823264 RepID=A0A8H5M4R9_9AGAR|nr:hypothetical protein D9757_007038 [Collybiopsis confluens]